MMNSVLKIGRGEVCSGSGSGRVAGRQWRWRWRLWLRLRLRFSWRRAEAGDTVEEPLSRAVNQKSHFGVPLFDNRKKCLHRKVTGLPRGSCTTRTIDSRYRVAAAGLGTGKRREELRPSVAPGGLLLPAHTESAAMQQLQRHSGVWWARHALPRLDGFCELIARHRWRCG